MVFPADAGPTKPLRALMLLLAVGTMTFVAACGGSDDDADDDASTTSDGGGTTSSTDDGSVSSTSTPETTETTALDVGAFSGLEEIASDLGQIGAIDVDADGAVWATESNDSRLLELTDGAPVEHYVGEQESTDPESTMSGLAIAPDGTVWFATRKGIHQLDPATDEATLVVGAAASALNGPTYSLAVGDDGTVFVADDGLRQVFRLDGAEPVLVAGSGGAPVSDEGTGDGGPAVDATFGAIRDLEVDADGNLYVADDYAQRVRRIAPDGTVDSIAGGGDVVVTGAGDPPPDGTVAVDLDLEAPTALVSIDGEVYLSDVTLSLVLAVDEDGGVRLVLPAVPEVGAVEHLAGDQADTIYVATPEIIGRLTA